MTDLAYNESMSLACQHIGGTCDDCPEAGEEVGNCSCVCHIPDATDTEPDEADQLAAAFYDRWGAQ